jgi:hypothetical protein
MTFFFIEIQRNFLDEIRIFSKMIDRPFLRKKCENHKKKILSCRIETRGYYTISQPYSASSIGINIPTTGTNFIVSVRNTAPIDACPSTASVSFDRLYLAYMSVSEYNQILNKIFDIHYDSNLGRVLY